MKLLDREEIIAAIVEQLETLEYVLALWEAGSAAFGRIDQYSDIDLHAIVSDDAVEQTFIETATALETLCPIIDRWRVAEPTWHGNSQEFFTLRDAPEYLLIDLAVLKESNEQKFLQPEMHGTPRVLINRNGTIEAGTQADQFDAEARLAYRKERVSEIALQFKRYQPYVSKEILRGDLLNAMHFFPRMTLAPLLELLRFKYDPARYSWGLRYLRYYLPEDERLMVESFNLIVDLADLGEKQQRITVWVEQLVDELLVKETL